MRMLSVLLVIPLVACGSGTIGGSFDARPQSGDAAVVDAPLVMGADARVVDANASGVPDARNQLVNDGGMPLCDSKTGGLVVCQCADGINNDSDGFIDSADPECAGPFDNDEATFGTGIPGDNRDPFVQDCFFDGDSGGGNDGCRWDIRCIDPPSGQHCNNNQLAGCEKCKPLVPNGCDCFGCCDVYVAGVVHTVRIVDTCTSATIDDPNACPVCTKVTECQNSCEMCEVCLGRPPDPSCALSDAGTPVVCEDPKFPCTQPDNSCPSEDYRCITGCCVKFLQ